jgi:hypothetical protein
MITTMGRVVASRTSMVVPHIYEAEFDYSSDEFGDTYFASPVDENLLALAMEDWEIWLRWNSAFKQGWRF